MGVAPHPGSLTAAAPRSLVAGHDLVGDEPPRADVLALARVVGLPAVADGVGVVERHRLVRLDHASDLLGRVVRVGQEVEQPRVARLEQDDVRVGDAHRHGVRVVDRDGHVVLVAGPHALAVEDLAVGRHALDGRGDAVGRELGVRGVGRDGAGRHDREADTERDGGAAAETAARLGGLVVVGGGGAGLLHADGHVGASR